MANSWVDQYLQSVGPSPFSTSDNQAPTGYFPRTQFGGLGPSINLSPSPEPDLPEFPTIESLLRRLGLNTGQNITTNPVAPDFDLSGSDTGDGGLVSPRPRKQTGISNGLDLNQDNGRVMKSDSPDYKIYGNWGEGNYVDDSSHPYTQRENQAIDSTRPTPPQDLRPQSPWQGSDSPGNFGNASNPNLPSDPYGGYEWPQKDHAELLNSPNSEKIDFNNIWSFLNPYSRYPDKTGKSAPNASAGSDQPQDNQYQPENDPNSRYSNLVNNLSFLWADPSVQKALQDWLPAQMRARGQVSQSNSGSDYSPEDWSAMDDLGKEMKEGNIFDLLAQFGPKSEEYDDPSSDISRPQGNLDPREIMNLLGTLMGRQKLPLYDGGSGGDYGRN